MGRPFKSEIAYIPNAIAWAADQDVVRLRRAILNVSSKCLYAVGSGGSFTAATFAASCHEKRFGRVSRAVTPLEYQSCGSKVPEAAALLLSAEGKNKDVLYSANNMLQFEHAGLALTLKRGSPLEAFAASAGALSVLSYDMPWKKDGYLATNSLIAMLFLLAKAYSQDEDTDIAEEAKAITEEWLHARREHIESVIKKVPPGLPTLVLHGSTGRIAAIDIESKFAEAAIGTCQLADYRQFAHGRHLQLNSPENAFVVAFTSAKDRTLAEVTLALLPSNVHQLVLELPDGENLAAIQGVIDAMLLTDVVSEASETDPGQPIVPEFCRVIHQLEPQALIATPSLTVPLPVARKLKRGAKNANEVHRFTVAAQSFAKQITNGNFKALVCDFDGTFCETDKRFEGLDPCLIEVTERILHHDIPIAFATGRGDSLLVDLRKKISKKYWHNVTIGYYSGSYIAPLDQNPKFSIADPRFENLLAWLMTMGVYAQIEATPKVKCGQLSLRCGNQTARHETLSAIRLWIRRNSYEGWRVYCSGHSIDVLTDWAGKQRVIDFMAKKYSLDPNSEVLRLGDSGDFDGNDYELLCEGLGLSVLTVSPDPATCWNFLPNDRRGVVGTLHYLASLHLVNGSASMPLAIFKENLNAPEPKMEST